MWHYCIQRVTLFFSKVCWRKERRKEGRSKRGKREGGREGGEARQNYGDGLWIDALFSHQRQNFPCSLYLSLVHFCILLFYTVLCIKMKCWFHHKPAWKQVHYTIHIFILAEITFQLFICFDINLLQETVAWKLSYCAALLKIPVHNSLNMLNLVTYW